MKFGLAPYNDPPYSRLTLNYCQCFFVSGFPDEAKTGRLKNLVVGELLLLLVISPRSSKMFKLVIFGG